MSKITEIEKLNVKFKQCLENYFNLIYIEPKVVREETIQVNIQDNLSKFKIKNSKDSIFKKITSIDTLSEVKKEIKSEYEKFTDEFLDYFDRVENQLDAKQVESFEIIEKTIKNRAKKLNSSIDKFMIEDSWNTTKISEEFYFKVRKNLNDIINSLISTISIGMKENSAYDGILKSLNKFLSQLGIYTLELDTATKYENFDFLEPQECEDCETKDINKQDMIKEILSYPYILNKEQIIMEGKVILWKVVHNG